jgi:thiol-disulfide isomerase/thioredoxin
MNFRAVRFIAACCVLVVVLGLVRESEAGATKLTLQNFDSTMSSSELVFVNFYANWCRFSQMLEPIFDEFADKAAKEYTVSSIWFLKNLGLGESYRSEIL